MSSERTGSGPTGVRRAGRAEICATGNAADSVVLTTRSAAARTWQGYRSWTGSPSGPRTSMRRPNPSLSVSLG
ncbi:hypothetical protein [Kitasatospora sp. NBC_01539]|uniref:hypothetical protein n=1 Tax=Kitasatospora sp. NBC_01539 TaxID=2903577 RepID=UPI003860282A